MVRTRFAPSPTGMPHIGHLRTAIYAYLTAKKHNGIFFVRLEDTDRDRYNADVINPIIDSIKWIGIKIDEGYVGDDEKEIGEYGPYKQSLRKDIYKKYALELVEKDGAYFCFCPKEEHSDIDYTDPNCSKNIHDMTCRNLTKEEVQKKIDDGYPYVIKHKVPLNEYIIVEDIIRGKQKISTNILDDSILLKSDGNATYHLAHLVDDYLMKTTYVIRSEEWLPSLPKHILLFKQMGWQPPIYAHPAQIMIIDKETGNKRKFSKRKNDPSVIDIIKAGYLPEAVLNFVVLLGWNPGKGETKEIFSMEELIKIFDLKDCNKAGALFDINKLNWINGKYIRQYDNKKLFEYITWYWQQYGDKEELDKMLSQNINFMLKIIDAVKQKIHFVKDFYQHAKIFWDYIVPENDIICNEKMNVDINIAYTVLKESLNLFENFNQDWNMENIKQNINNIKEKLNYTNGQVLWTLRACLSGSISSPGAYEMIYILGKDEVIKRIKNFLFK